MKNLIIIISIVVVLTATAKAQIGAALTNRVLVKTDLTEWLNQGENAEIEIKILKQYTINAGFFSDSREYNQLYTGTQFAGSSKENAFFGDNTVSVPGKGIINSEFLFLSLRKYFSNIKRAPFGLYVSLTGSYGKADLSGTYPAYLLDPNVRSLDDGLGPIVKYSYFNVRLYKGMAGIGYQGLLFWHLYYDISAHLEYDHFIGPTDTDTKIMSGITRYYGASSGTIGGVGLTGQVKLGYLIY